jgi:hypothetical protein
MPEAGELQYRFIDTIAEIDFVASLPRAFLYPSAERVLREYHALLTQIRDSRTTGELSIAEDAPLVTAPSSGQYDKGKGQPVFAEIATTWGINCIPPKKGSRHPELYVVVGKASTAVKLFEGTPEAKETLLTTWKMELGARDAPGCYFHSHIHDTCGIPVPRLPILPATPMAVVEFVLGELFQEKWEKFAAKESYHQSRWRTLQGHRLAAHARWQTNELNNSAGSPWVVLKRAMPPTSLFVAKE